MNLYNVTIIDSDSNVQLLNNDKQKGMIYDVENKLLICPFSKSIKVYRENKLNELLENNKNVSIFKGIEGQIIRLFKYSGKIYFSTHRKLNARELIYNNTKLFDIYVKLKGPLDELTENYCYTFLICSPEVLKTSKIKLKAGFLVLLNIYKFNDTNENAIKFKVEENPNEDLVEPYITFNLPISIENAQKFLKYGYHDSDKFNGEFILVENESTIFRVYSKDYMTRYSIVRRCYNVRKTFYYLLNDIKTKKYYLKYYKMPYYEDTSLQKSIPITDWNKIEVSQDLRNDEARTIWLNILASVPLHKQELVLPLYEDYINSYNALVKYTNNIHLFYKNLEDANVEDFFKDIIRKSREHSIKLKGVIINNIVENSIDFLLKRQNYLKLYNFMDIAMKNII